MSDCFYSSLHLNIESERIWGEEEWKGEKLVNFFLVPLWFILEAGCNKECHRLRLKISIVSISLVVPIGILKNKTKKREGQCTRTIKMPALSSNGFTSRGKEKYWPE